MKIEVIASSSSGNCYIVRGARDALILEAGVPIASIKKALRYKLHDVVGALVSHSHGDHSKSVKDLLKLSVKVYSSFETFDALGLSAVFSRSIKILPEKPGSIVTVGEFKIMPFAVEHDAAGTLGFLIKSNALQQTLVFATDTFYLKYKFKGVDLYMIEANYAKEILEENIISGQIHHKRAERTTQSHFEINDVVDFLKATDTTRTKAVMLLHPSSSNADTKDFEKKVSEAIGINTVTAKAGMTVEI